MTLSLSSCSCPETPPPSIPAPDFSRRRVLGDFPPFVRTPPTVIRTVLTFRP